MKIIFICLKNEGRRKVEIVIAPTGAYKEMSGDGCHMTNKQQYHSIQYIQNRTNWCWAVACRMVGEQFKRNHLGLDFCIPSCGEENVETDIEVGDEKGVRTNDRKGLRMDVVEWDGEFFRVDPWQRAVVDSISYYDFRGNKLKTWRLIEDEMLEAGYRLVDIVYGAGEIFAFYENVLFDDLHISKMQTW